ncbi:MAG: hypothetical protein K5869_10955 [Saccharofermentans sp.]|nr:hypothetical protein [Saccharofermentans sp.]
MHTYIFNSRDVAAYFKYFSVPSYLEVSYMQYIFNLGNKILAEPLTRDFEHFKNEVFRELYFLWANGFEGERSDISAMTADGQLALICDQECINLESYMKLICLHLIFSGNLPYINLNFTGMMYQLGLKCDVNVYEENVRKIMESLRLVAYDSFGHLFDLALGVPDELLRVSLREEFKSGLVNRNFRESLKNEQLSWLAELKEKSLKVFGSIPARRRTAASSRSSDKRQNPGSVSGAKYSDTAAQMPSGIVQPKGAPSKGNRK